MFKMDIIMPIIDIFMGILGVILIFFVFISILIIILILQSKQKMQKEDISLINNSLVLFGILSVYQILFKINEAKMSDFEDALMFFGNIMIYCLPVIFFFMTIYLIKNVLGFRKGKEKINSTISIASIVISTILVVYYLPTRNIINAKINGFYINRNNSIIADTYDPEKIDQLMGTLNKHTFIRSATVTPYNPINGLKYADINLTTGLGGVFRRYNLRIYINDNIANTLYINDQRYKVRDGKKFTQEILAVFNSLEISPEAMEGFTLMSTDEKTYHLPVIGILLSIKNVGYERVYTIQKCIIEQYENDHWERIKYNGEIHFNGFNGALHSIDRNTKRDFYIPLDNLKETLKPGKYRIVKTINSVKGEFNVTCEFNLE